MANQPVIREIAWISMIPQLFFMLLLFLFYKLIGCENFLLWGAITYLLISFSLRRFIPNYHRKGIKLSAKGNFVEAIQQYENSVEFFTKYSWIDKYRYITLLSSSKMGYREMGLCNIAFCYGQLGDIEQTKKYYQIVVDEFPENGIAPSALRMLNALESNKVNG